MKDSKDFKKYKKSNKIMDKLRKESSIYYSNHCNKKEIGGLLLAVGAILFFLGSRDINLILSIEGILIGCMGAGLLTLGINEKKNDSSENINIYIGKQLFDRGLEGFVIGVVVGALKLFFKYQ
ncbi:hypothetical protein [Carnobacterium mobile]|uniref:hypothetical protein n=1 Tax=Carnobacterium mobile TaxID=2750 RepID=UPI0005590FA8|nr:hypothetical protein [Carnobacterium mobile]